MGDNARKWILRFTSNTFSAILTGTVVTTLLDSSSAVIIITIIFVNSHLLTFRQAMGIVLGANIGTTVSSQIIAMDIGKYSPVLLLFGFILILISKSERVNNSGKIILYFGVLFFGLFTMEKSVEPLRSSSSFVNVLTYTQNPLSGAFIGAVATLIIQSSSATVGMAIILTKKGLLTIAGAIAVMLGAELGTCSDTLLATIRGSRQALKTGIFHLLFNLFSIVTGLVFFKQFVAMVVYFSKNSSPQHTVANAHMLFNIGGVVLIVFALPMIEKGLNKLLPDNVQSL